MKKKNNKNLSPFFASVKVYLSRHCMFEQIITLISLWSPFGHFVAFFNLYFIVSRISNNIYKLWLFKKDCLKFTYYSDKISRFCRFSDLFRSDQIIGYFPLALMVNSESAAQVSTDWAHSCPRNFHVLCSCCPAGRLCFHVSSCSTQWDPKKRASVSEEVEMVACMSMFLCLLCSWDTFVLLAELCLSCHSQSERGNREVGLKFRSSQRNHRDVSLKNSLSEILLL